MMIEQNYNLDLVPSGTPLVVYVSQFDKGGRRLSFTLYKDNVAFTLPTGASATILGTKPDKIAFMYAMQTSGNKLYIDVTEQMTAVAGPVQCEIRVSNTAGEKIGSSNFIIYCEKTPLDSDAVISETDIPVFEELVAQANTAAAEANTASTQAQQYAQEAQESAESIDVSALEAQIASKAPSVSPTLRFGITASANGNSNPHVELRETGSTPTKGMGIAIYNEDGTLKSINDLVTSAGNRNFATVPEVDLKAPIDSPAFTGTPTSTTTATENNSTRIATTAYVKNNLANYAPLASPALTGTPTAPTASVGTNTTQIATTAFVANSIDALQSALFYKEGDTYASLAGFQTVGMTTNGNKNLYLTVTVPKLLTNINSVTVTRLIGAIRGVNGYIGGSSDGNFDWLTQSYISSVTASKVTDNQIRIIIVTDTALSNATNNTPVVLNGQVTFTFS